MAPNEFPKIEDLDTLVGDAHYADGIRWRVFVDIDGDMPGRNVLIVLGDQWTMISGEDFSKAATRILAQL
jgi:hypothetical protein